MPDYLEFEDVLKELEISELELHKMISDGEVVAFKDEQNRLKFLKADIEHLKKTKPKSEYFSFDELVKELGITQEKLDEMISDGAIRAFKDPAKGSLRFRKEDVDSLKAILQPKEEKKPLPEIKAKKTPGIAPIKEKDITRELKKPAVSEEVPGKFTEDLKELEELKEIPVSEEPTKKPAEEPSTFGELVIPSEVIEEEKEQIGAGGLEVEEADKEEEEPLEISEEDLPKEAVEEEEEKVAEVVVPPKEKKKPIRKPLEEVEEVSMLPFLVLLVSIIILALVGFLWMDSLFFTRPAGGKPSDISKGLSQKVVSSFGAKYTEYVPDGKGGVKGVEKDIDLEDALKPLPIRKTEEEKEEKTE